MRIVLNGEEHETDTDITLAALLQKLNLPPKRVAVEVNREVIPRDRHAHFAIHEGDRLEVVTLVGGG